MPVCVQSRKAARRPPLYHEIYERLPALCERFFRHRAYSARVSPDYDGGADILLFGKYTSSMLEQLLQELLLFFSRAMG